MIPGKGTWPGVRPGMTPCVWKEVPPALPSASAVFLPPEALCERAKSLSEGEEEEEEVYEKDCAEQRLIW